MSADRFGRELLPSLNHPDDLLSDEEREQMYADLKAMADTRARVWCESRFLCFGG